MSVDMEGLTAVPLFASLLYVMNQDMTLHTRNWKPLLLTALMIAQKTWDDRALRNRDFPAVRRMLASRWVRHVTPIMAGTCLPAGVGGGLLEQLFLGRACLSVVSMCRGSDLGLGGSG